MGGFPYFGVIVMTIRLLTEPESSDKLLIHVYGHVTRKGLMTTDGTFPVVVKDMLHKGERPLLTFTVYHSTGSIEKDEIEHSPEEITDLERVYIGSIYVPIHTISEEDIMSLYKKEHKDKTVQELDQKILELKETTASLVKLKESLKEEEYVYPNINYHEH